MCENKRRTTLARIHNDYNNCGARMLVGVIIVQPQINDEYTAE